MQTVISKTRHLESLVGENSVLILDFAQWTVNYMRNIVNHDSSCITTNTGSKTLPTNLWHRVLSLVEDDWEGRFCRPVYAVGMCSAQLNGTGPEPALVCKIINTWWSFGDIEEVTVLEHCENYLKNLSYEPKGFEEGDCIVECPFQLSKTGFPDKSCTIPTSHLCAKNAFLHYDATAPDMIAWCEDGECGLCDNNRGFAKASGRSWPKIIDEWRCWNGQCLSTYTKSLCPLCMGIEYARTSIEETYKDDAYYSTEGEFYEWEAMYREWENERLVELGYLH
ncbi:cuticle-degrading protease [Fusarium longipes]|uniref:Cuticle-degrading protease n=1 Tax=Fusarium longipes TaxID=694270 RepID=A0A395T4F0_9HYPO|nr:cuticle-degrading protease [Fusarium longipes]